MEEWKEYKVAEIVEEISMGPFGSNIKVDNFIDFGIPVLNGSNLQGFKLNENSFNYVSKEKADSLGKANAYRGDVVITHRGTLGQIVYIPSDSKFERYVISQSQFRLRLKQDIVRPDFFVYFFHTKDGQHRILMNASQVGVPALARPTSTFKDVAICLPNLDVQNSIMDILLALDNRIEVNKRINDNLEQQAQALYKSWFVDFEPFKEGGFVESELGMIPRGWKIYSLSEFLPVITGKKDANMAKGGIYPFFSCSQDFSWTDNYSFDGCAILVAGNGDFNVKMYSGKFEAYQRTYVLIPYNAQYTAWLYYAVKYHLNTITSAARGSVIKFITKGNLADFHFPAPINIEFSALTEKFDRIRALIASNEQESRRLAQLRDALLPRLMSGELKVKDIDQ